MAVSKISWLLPPSILKLSINDVHVWRVRLNQTDGRVQQLQQILSDDERLRAERFHFDRDRRRFLIAGHARKRTLKRVETDYTTAWIGLMFPWLLENPPDWWALKEVQSKLLVGL